MHLNGLSLFSTHMSENGFPFLTIQVSCLNTRFLTRPFGFISRATLKQRPKMTAIAKHDTDYNWETKDSPRPATRIAWPQLPAAYNTKKSAVIAVHPAPETQSADWFPLGTGIRWGINE
jgi:hypothetical protein